MRQEYSENIEWIDDELEENEEIIFHTRLHMYMFFTPFSLMLCSFLSIWFFFIGIAHLLYVTIRYFYLEYVITGHRVIMKKGLFYIRTESIPISLIEDVLIRQSLWDKVIRGGTIFIFGSSIKTRKLSGMGNPATFRNALYSQLPATTVGYSDIV